jgi:uncharacterized membrane protein/predicted DsbA family dithiol-disulfide isomerase
MNEHASAGAPASSHAGAPKWVYAAVVLPLIVGLLAACSLLVDYTRPSAVFCNDVASGCNAVRLSPYAHWGLIPTPVFGVVGFSLLTLLALLEGRTVRRLFLAAASVGALAALGLIGIQAKLGHFCVYCMFTDISALVLFGIAVLRLWFNWELPRSFAAHVPVLHGISGLLILCAAAGILVYGFRQPLPPPETLAALPLPTWIAAEIEKSAKGELLVVDFVDFECPFCREMHENLQTAIARHPRPVRTIRKHVPLRMHPHAEGAARAGICAEAQGKGDAMADALIRTEVEKLEEPTYRSLAEQLKLDLPAFDTCRTAAATTERLAADKATFQAAQGRGLPLIFLGKERLSGLQETPELEKILTKAN